jgi:CheY-like chemotaxis protein
MGGDIQVDSALGRGTTFRIRLPVAPAFFRAAPVVPLVAPKRPLTPRRVLVVDDDPEVRAALSRIIGPPHCVELADTARDALRCLLERGEEYDVIFCDLMMPDLTGMDLHEALSQQRPELLSRMVFMSAGAFTPRAVTFLERNSVRRIDKPFDPVGVRELL